MCDIGGSSLELAELGNGVVGQCLSSPLGPLKLKDLESNKRLLESEIVNRLKILDGISYFSKKDLFLVGGSWRAIARLDMERRKYPLKVLHEYEMTEESSLKTVKWILTRDITKMQAITGIE